MSLTSLLPQLRGLHLVQIILDAQHLVLEVAASRRSAPCSACARRATRVYSRYGRTIADLPIGGRRVRLRLQVRRFRCGNRRCSRAIFAERFPELVAPYGRRSHAQRENLEAVGFALGGAAGSRLAAQLDIPASRATLLRLVRATAAEASETPRVLGIDDWARRKGQTYGTILVDLERRRVVDLLDDRTADSLAAWLHQHPGVEVIARDRAGAYADGARRGAPGAVQVADRFHLLANVGETVERVMQRKRALLKETARVVDQLRAVPTDGAPSASSHSVTRTEQQQQARRQQRLERYEAVVALHQAGFTASQIARDVGLGRKTVGRFLRAGSFPERAQTRRRTSILAPFEPYLRERWTAGCHNALQLWREIRHRGFSGAASLVRRWVAAWRPEPGRRGRPPRRASPVPCAPPPPTPMRVPSPRQARWILLGAVERLSPEEQLYREYLLRTDHDVRGACQVTAGRAPWHTRSPA